MTILDKHIKRAKEEFETIVRASYTGILGEEEVEAGIEWYWKFIEEELTSFSKDMEKEIIKKIRSWATQNIKDGKDYDKLYEFLESLETL